MTLYSTAPTDSEGSRDNASLGKELSGREGTTDKDPELLLTKTDSTM